MKKAQVPSLTLLGSEQIGKAKCSRQMLWEMLNLRICFAAGAHTCPSSRGGEGVGSGDEAESARRNGWQSAWIHGCRRR